VYYTYDGQAQGEEETVDYGSISLGISGAYASADGVSI